MTKVVLGLLFLALYSNSEAQTLQAGIAGNIGMSGVGIEADAAHRRAGVFLSAQTAFESGARMAGARAYVIGHRGSGFYISGARAQLRCAAIRLNGSGSDCTGGWHDAWTVLGGVEIGSSESPWSVYVDAGPFIGLDDAPGLRNWTFLFGARIRGPR
jgi:hypothetical protein